ncbi:MAG: efflux RND transporter permease subunit [Eubacteriaceae bacterium]|nr:efflux RND transporter permease subunit [Eubacteriaceae bacterium]
MKHIASGVVKHRKMIFLIALFLLIPSVIGILNTRINYDVLVYLPDNIQTVQGQNILKKDFGTGGLSMLMVSGMSDNDVSKLKSKIKDVKHVKDVIWYDDLADVTMPKEMIPEKYYKAFNSGDTTMMAIFFDSPVSSDNTISAVQHIRRLSTKQCLISGTAAYVTDLKELCEKEEPIYILIAVLLVFIVLAVFMDSWMIPFLILFSIGLEVIYNFGTNFVVGDVSYITKALAAVLQLGVTMDLSIFLMNSYKEQQQYYGDHDEAMRHAIVKTSSAITASALTLMAGFLAMCFMSFTLGFNLGIVMAKGVLFGVIGTFTILPGLILMCDKAIVKTTHHTFHMRFGTLSHFITGRPWLFVIIFLLILGPAYYGYSHTNVYYDLFSTLPANLPSVKATKQLSDKFDLNTTHMVLADSKLSANDMDDMIKDVEGIKGVNNVIGLQSIVGPAVPEEILPQKAVDTFKSGKYQMLMINTKYKVASNAVNKQITQINTAVHKYDSKAMVIGEGPLTKDLIKITDKDFKVVTWISLLAIFIILGFVLQSFSLPFILVAVIQMAIFVNLGIPHYTGTSLAFIASICIGTIQLGSCVNYAILMTTRYKAERYAGKLKREAIEIAHSTSVTSVIISATGFFAATFGVAMYSDIEIISSMCLLLARGALISATMVIFILPALLYLLDGLIIKTSRGFKKKEIEGAEL